MRIIAAHEVIHELTAERGDERLRLPEPFGRARVHGVGSARLRRSVTVDGDQGRADRNLKRELLPIPLRTFRERL